MAEENYKYKNTQPEQRSMFTHVRDIMLIIIAGIGTIIAVLIFMWDEPREREFWYNEIGPIKTMKMYVVNEGEDDPDHYPSGIELTRSDCRHFKTAMKETSWLSMNPVIDTPPQYNGTICVLLGYDRNGNTICRIFDYNDGHIWREDADGTIYEMHGDGAKDVIQKLESAYGFEHVTYDLEQNTTMADMERSISEFSQLLSEWKNATDKNEKERLEQELRDALKENGASEEEIDQLLE